MRCRIEDERKQRAEGKKKSQVKMWATRKYVLSVMRREEETPNKDVKVDKMKGDVEVFRNTQHLRSSLVVSEQSQT